MRKTKRYAECIWIESESNRTRRISETGDKRKQITKQKRERERGSKPYKAEET